MSYPARVFRILIASPADVTEERDIAVRTIQEWNDLNSAERQLVLLPLRWETHSAPEYGRRPQEVINRQVVDHSDLLVGVFWTRVGSPTGVADSGTLEEIERVATRGKPVMLYFSQAKQEPDRIDIDQLQKLREFRKKTFPKALVEQYTTQIEFRDKLAKQLEIQLRSLLATEGEGLQAESAAAPITDIQVEFADPQTGSPIGMRITVESTAISLEGIEGIPDYTESKRSRIATPGEQYLIIGDTADKDYYRDFVRYVVRRSLYRPIRFWMKNVGALGARDVYVDVRVSSLETDLHVSSLEKAALSPPTTSHGWLSYGSLMSSRSDDVGEPQQQGGQWVSQLELRALQPQREVSPPPSLVLGAKKSGLVTVTARIYADTLPQPVTRTLQIDWHVQEKTVRAVELLETELPSLKR